jgi:hypothetical protein
LIEDVWRPCWSSLRRAPAPARRRFPALSPVSNKVIIENGETESYWLKVDRETYAGLSNRREVKTVDGQAQVSETEGMKIKEHRRDCIIKITADAASIIRTSEIIGNPANCENLLDSQAT